MRRLTMLFPSKFLEEHAEELGVIERNRKTQMPALVWSFVFGFATGESRTLGGFRRIYNATADEALSPGGFCQRLTPACAECQILPHAALLSLLMSHDLLDLVAEQTDNKIVFPLERRAATFQSHAQLIPQELGEHPGYSPPPLLGLLINDAQKIHKQRPILQETLATATQPRGEA